MSNFDIKTTFHCDGIEYRFDAGFGVQVYSTELSPLPNGYCRFFFERLFYVWSCKRMPWHRRWDIAWSLVTPSGRIEIADIDSLRDFLSSKI